MKSNREMKIGTRIREIRKNKGLTILQLATAINSDVGNISRLETNKQGYSEAMLSKIATALGVPVAEFFTDTDVKNIAPSNELREDEIELLILYNKLPKEESQKFLNEMRSKHSHYEAIFEEMLKQRKLGALK